MGDLSFNLMLQQFLIRVLIVCGPVVLTVFIAGVVVGIAQAVTQVQDQSISYGVKIVLVILILLIFGRWMGQLMLSTFNNSFDAIVEVGLSGGRSER